MHAQPRRPPHGNLRALDDLLPKRHGPGRPPRISNAELISLAVAQIFMGSPKERHFLVRDAGGSLICFAISPASRAIASGCERSPRRSHGSSRSSPVSSPSFCDRLRLLRLHARAVRAVARDGQTLRPRRIRGLRLVQSFTPASSGASASTCCALPTACRSRSSPPPPTRPSARSLPRSSSAPTWDG